jgi:hypothetical protein
VRTTTPITSRKSSVQKPGFPDGFLGAVVKIVEGVAAKDTSMNKGYIFRQSLFDAKEAIRKELGFRGYF